MKFYLLLFSTLFCTTLMAKTPVAAPAPNAKTSVFAFVRSEALVNGFVETQKANEMLASEKTRLEGQLKEITEKANSKLKVLNERLERSVLAKDTERIQELNELIRHEKESYQDTAKKMDEAYNTLRQNLFNKIRETIDAAIRDYAQSQGIQFIFGTAEGNLVYADTKNDLTQVILEKLNKKP